MFRLRCLAHRRFSVGKSVGRVAQRLPFIFTPFASNCNDRSIIIRLHISLQMGEIQVIFFFWKLDNGQTGITSMYLQLF